MKSSTQDTRVFVWFELSWIKRRPEHFRQLKVSLQSCSWLCLEYHCRDWTQSGCIMLVPLVTCSVFNSAGALRKVTTKIDVTKRVRTRTSSSDSSDSTSRSVHTGVLSIDTSKGELFLSDPIRNVVIGVVLWRQVLCLPRLHVHLSKSSWASRSWRQT